jgi:hypothetical protein
MIQIELQLEPTEIEKFTLFGTHIESFSIEDLSSQDKQTYMDMIGLVGDARVTINETSNEYPIIIFRENMFEVNEDMSISSIYPVEVRDYSTYNSSERNTIDNFIDLIDRIKS